METPKKKNIIISLNSFWNNGKGMSGGDQMLFQVFRRVRNSFGSVWFYSGADGRLIFERDVSGSRCYSTPNFFDMFPLPINYCVRALRTTLGAFFKWRRVDILYAGSDFFPDVIPAFLYRMFHPKTLWFQCIFHIYPDWRTRPGNKLVNFLAQSAQRVSLLLARRADVILNINYQVRDELVRMGFRKDSIIVNPPGIDIEYLRNFKAPDSTPEYDATFLARLNPSKGIFDLPKIWKRVVEKRPEARLAIIGGGSEEMKKRLSEKIRRLDLEQNVSVLGFLEDDAAFGLIQRSGVFILPSHEEGFGIVLAEAMALGVPTVAWNLSVYDEVFEHHVFTISESDIDSFADQVVAVLSERGKLAARISEAGRFVGKYSWDSIAKKHLRILLGEKMEQSHLSVKRRAI